jgi:ribosomal protein S18 acetylase RimI-like enzyme
MTTVRTTVRTDAGAIRRIAAKEPLFSKEDREVVDELLEDFFETPRLGDYYFLTAVAEGEVCGFACYGPTPLTRGTYDLYWICVKRNRKRKGYGRALLREVIARIRRRRGRLVVLDTSGRADFASTRAFYGDLGFRPAARVADFYRPGDDLLIYTYRLRATRRAPGRRR